MSEVPESLEERPSDEASTEAFFLGGPPPSQVLPLRAEFLERGGAMGRYVILDRIGTGGMGVVYSAYDPELDRKVALKLLRPDRGSSSGDAARLRLLREAQAIARLSHPNVIAVYDTGSFGDQVFIAMEFVEGWTLRQWIEEKEPSWREILGRFVLAGRGLAAAHAAGLVHRDFKPDNVLLGKDGRVRVVDFGIARPLEGSEAPAEGGGPLSGSGSILATPLTQWGVALGTPAYMAPEQLRGEAADARTDQFSFCVSLYEAFYGERPFPGTETREILAAVRRGTVREEPAATRVPRHLRAVLLRGLSAAPSERYPSMEALLHDLERDPVAVRRLWLAAAAVILVTGAVFSGFGWVQARRVRLCSGAEEKMAAVWDRRKPAVRAAFLATGVSFAPESWRRAETALDSYARSWMEMRRDTCEATRLRGEQSEGLLDRRMYCLDQRLGEVRALTDLFSHADAGVVEAVDNAVSGLGKIEVCSDTEMLTARVPPPRNPALRSRVEAARSRLASAKSLSDAGKHTEALAGAQEAAAAAQRAGYRPLQAEALYLLGDLQDKLADSRRAEGTMFDALLTAQEGGDFLLAGEAAAELAWIVGFQQSRTEEGRRWSRIAEATVQGARGGAAARSIVLKQLAVIFYQEGRYSEAARVARLALAITERAYGPAHPQVANVLSNLAVFYDMAGNKREALAAGLRSLEVRRQVLPPGHPDFAKSFNTLGNVYSNLNQPNLALSYYQRAYEIFRSRYGDRHPSTTGVRGNIGILAKDLGRYEEALRIYGEELRGAEKAYGPEHPDVARALDHVGEVYFLQRRFGEALATFRRVLAIYEKTVGPSHPDTATALQRIGETLTESGRLQEAVEPLTRSLTVLESRDVDRGVRAESRFYLARALWGSGGDRQKARRLAREAREDFSADGREKDVKTVDEWLARNDRMRQAPVG
jgi:eukaryotic-like serine/threonine-protein kinase